MANRPQGEGLAIDDASVNAWLIAHGHNEKGACEKCWAEANRREFIHGGEHYDHYRAAMRESEAEAAAALASLPPEAGGMASQQDSQEN